MARDRAAEAARAQAYRLSLWGAASKKNNNLMNPNDPNDYRIPVTDAYKYGPYMHSVEKNYRYMANTFMTPLIDIHLNNIMDSLRDKLQDMKQVEQGFYNLFNVKDALDFSQTYLWGKGEPIDDNATIAKKLQKILKNEEVYNALSRIEPGVEAKLESVASKLLEENPVLQQFIQKDAEYKALTAVLNSLNSMRTSNSNLSLTINKQAIKIEVPKNPLTSLKSSYIYKLLEQVDQEAISNIKRNFSSRINKVMGIFDSQSNILGSDAKYYREMLLHHLEGAAGIDEKYIDEKNVSMFMNYSSAIGGIFEIIMTMGLRPSDEYQKGVIRQNEMLANDTIEDFRTQYKFTDKGGKVEKVITSSGKEWRVVSKSPTDLVIQDYNGNSYTIQLKNTVHDVTSNNSLKLQSEIQLPTFLANVHDVLGGGEVMDLLIYHIVNNSTFPNSSSNNTILKTLSACVEYYVESRYIRNMSENWTDISKDEITNAGNMFMIYSNYLIPMSAFIEYTLKAFDNNSHIFAPPSQGVLSYGTTFSVDQIIGKSFEERISMGRSVYNSAKITELDIVVGKILDYMGAFSG